MSIVPKYKLEVGSRLRYRMSDEAAGGAASRESAEESRLAIEWDFSVISHHRDHGWRVFFTESRAQESGTLAGKGLIRNFYQDGFFDIAEDGQLIENWTITPLANPTPIFPQLPKDPGECETGWRSALQLDGTRCQYFATSAAPASESKWNFAQECRTQLDPVYLASRQRDYMFDLRRGVVDRVTTAFQRGWPAPWNSSDSIHLVEIIQPNASDPKPIRQEVERYFDACAEYQRFIDLALWDVIQSSHWLEQARGALAAYERTAEIDSMSQCARRRLTVLDDERDNLLSEAQQLARTIDQPSPDWRAADLNGNVRALHDFRGRPLVLVFWNRGCSWCIRALLALNRLASEIAESPIAFLGVNVDQQVHEAVMVAQALDLSFPNIPNIGAETNIASSYGIDGFPTTVLIDQFGLVRRVRSGYSAQLSSLLAYELRHLQ
jgi:peroxiredoxin